MTNVAIAVKSLGKCYHMYAKPRDRLFQMLLRGKRRFYREFWALSDVSFTVQRGEIVGIIGRNGSGKSTLLQLICGTLNPSVGDIQVEGRIAALLELGAGFNPEFTGRENVFLNGEILGLSKAEITSRFDDIVAFADIGEHLDQPVKTYSSGMFVRLAFAVVAHSSPQVLVVDEALSVGDIRFQAKCLRKIEELKRLGCTILFVSHSAQQVEALCQRVIWLSEGKLVAQGSAQEIVRRYVNEMVHGTRGASVEHESSPSPLAPAEVGAHWTKVTERNSVEGGRKGKITQVRVLSGSGQNLTVADSSRAEVVVEALVDISERLPEPSFAVGVLNSLNEPVVHFNTQNTANGLPPFELNARQVRIRARFSMPPLRPGEYLIAVGLDNGTAPYHELVHHVYDAAQISVRPAPLGNAQSGYVQVEDVTVTVEPV